MKTEADVLIIGGGPAGLAAGIALASRGLHTMVCEKRSLPADKACGEGVMPMGLVHLERLGVKRHLTTRHHFAFDGIRYISPQGKTASATFREGPGWGIPRLDLSAALLSRANELYCLEVHAGVQADPIGVDRERGRAEVQVGGQTVRARLLIGADGLNSAVRRWAGLQGPKGIHQRWGVRQHFRMAPWSNKVEVYWNDGLEAYITPVDENLVGVAFLWDRRHRRLAGGANLIPTLLDAFPVLDRRLKHVTAMDAALAIGPMQRIATGPTADAAILIGDAAGYLDALTGEGISLALAQAVSLGDTLAPLLLRSESHGLIVRRDLAVYEREYRKIMQPYYTVTHLALWLSHHPNLAEQAIGLLGRAPLLFQFLLSANMGLAPRFLTNKNLP